MPNGNDLTMLLTRWAFFVTVLSTCLGANITFAFIDALLKFHLFLVCAEEALVGCFGDQLLLTALGNTPEFRQI